MKLNQRIALGAAGLALATTGVLGAATFANAETTASPTPAASATTDPGATDAGQHDGRGPGGRHGGKMDGQLAADLATKLGLAEADVQTALDNAHESLRPTTKPTTPPTEADKTAREAAMAEALATELKVDQAKVATALQEIRAERDATRKAEFQTKLDQAVTDGKLTQAEADAVMKAADAGVIGMGGPRH